MKNGSLPITSAPARSWRKVAKAVSKSRSVLACRTWTCSPRVAAASCRTLDWASARASGLVDEHCNDTVAVGTNSCISSSRFGSSSTSQPGHAREVAARPVEAGDKPSLDRVVADPEDDRNRRGCRFCRRRRRRTADGDDHSHLTENQIGCQCRQAVVLIFRQAIFDRHVLAFDIAGFFQALAERGQDGLRSRPGDRC